MVTVPSLYDHKRSLYDHYTIVVPSLYDHCTIIVRSLDDHWTIIGRSLDDHCTIIRTRSRIISHLVLTCRPSLSFSPGTQTSYLMAKYSKSYLIGYPAFLIVIVSIIPEYVSWRQTSSLNIQIYVLLRI